MDEQVDQVQVVESDSESRIRLGGYLQFLLTILVVWLFANSWLKTSRYSLHNGHLSLYRINEVTGEVDRYDQNANGWVKIMNSGMAYTIQEDATSE